MLVSMSSAPVQLLGPDTKPLPVRTPRVTRDGLVAAAKDAIVFLTLVGLVVGLVTGTP
jgi:hypothetical protein